jgi:DNA-binding IclR family transcriptional regulator
MADKSPPLQRVVEVLETVAAAHGGLSLSDIARRTGLPKGTVHRMLQNLIEVGYLSGQGGRAVYTLGPRLLRLLQLSIAPVSLVSMVTPVLQSVVDQFNEAAFITRLAGLEAELITALMPNNDGRVHIHPGQFFPIHASASAKAIFAFQPEGVLEQVLAVPLPQFTPHTLTDRHELDQHFARVRQQGYGVNDEELDLGVLSIACPISVGEAGVLYSIGIVGLKQALMQRSSEADLVAALKTAAERIGYILQTGLRQADFSDFAR